MGYCYCAQISTYKLRMKKLDNGILAIEQCEPDIENIRNSLIEMIAYNKDCFDAENMSALNNEVQNLQDRLESEKNKLKAKMNNKIQQLKSDLEDMEKEDRKYHEEEDPEYEG